jgi:Ca2+-binding RTX toxin-like protein
VTNPTSVQHASHAGAPSPASAIRITQDSSSCYLITDGQSVVVEPNVLMTDPSFAAQSVGTETFASGLGDATGGDNHVNVLGTVEGFVGTYFREGSNRVTVENGGLVDGFNAGVELHDGGHSLLMVRAGGEVYSHLYAVWCGDTPHVDYTLFPDSGADEIVNAGLIEGDRREAVRMVEGGNRIDNTGTIRADYEQAIQIDSATTDPRNMIDNGGSIVAGPRGAAIVSGDAALSVVNTGTITGDIQFGAGADRLSGTGHVAGAIFGGAGNDILVGGTGDFTFDGGLGADKMFAGSGVNTFIYSSAADSTTGLGLDTIDGFDFARDHLVVGGATIDSFETINVLRALQPGHAAIAENAQETVIIVDENGITGYQAGADLLIKITHAHNMDSIGGW